MSAIFLNIWNLWWFHGWASFLGIGSYTIVGAIVIYNVCEGFCGRPWFFRFLIIAALCGPVGWLFFSWWTLLKTFCLIVNILDMIDIDNISKWVTHHDD